MRIEATNTKIHATTPNGAVASICTGPYPCRRTITRMQCSNEHCIRAWEEIDELEPLQFLDAVFEGMVSVPPGFTYGDMESLARDTAFAADVYNFCREYAAHQRRVLAAGVIPAGTAASEDPDRRRIFDLTLGE